MAWLLRLRRSVADSIAPDEDQAETLDGGRSKSRAELPKWLIRLVVLAVGVLSAATALRADTEPLPSIALGQDYLYRLEVLLLLFYGALLLATPLLQGLLNGRLPTEITARGAKYDPEEVSDSLKETEDRVTAIENTLKSTGGETFSLRADLAQLQNAVDELKRDLGR